MSTYQPFLPQENFYVDVVFSWSLKLLHVFSVTSIRWGWVRSRCYDATRRSGDICEGARNLDKKKDRHMETSTHHMNWQMDTKNDEPWKMYLGLEKLVSFWVSMMDLTLCSAFQNSFGKLGARNLLCCFSWQSCTTKRRFETIFYFYPDPWGHDPIWLAHIFKTESLVQPPTRPLLIRFCLALNW